MNFQEKANFNKFLIKSDTSELFWHNVKVQHNMLFNVYEKPLNAVILFSFLWAPTREGRQFWAKIHVELNDYLNGGKTDFNALRTYVNKNKLNNETFYNSLYGQ